MELYFVKCILTVAQVEIWVHQAHLIRLICNVCVKNKTIVKYYLVLFSETSTYFKLTIITATFIICYMGSTYFKGVSNKIGMNL